MKKMFKKKKKGERKRTSLIPNVVNQSHCEPPPILGGEEVEGLIYSERDCVGEKGVYLGVPKRGGN